MSDFQERMEAIRRGHERMQAEFRRIEAVEGEPPAEEGQVTLSPAWKAWYDDFNVIKDQMYALAYDLDIPFEKGPDAVASAADYSHVWDQVQLALSDSGSRRVKNL